MSEAVSAAGQRPAAFKLGPDSTLSFFRLSMAPHGDECVVGSDLTGTFVSIPAVGADVLRDLLGGATIAEAAAAAAVRGTDVDALDFAATLIECGFVQAVDGAPVREGTPEAPESRSLASIRPEAVRPLFSPVAWALYGLLFLYCIVIFIVRPHYWPAYSDYFFLPDPALSLVIMSLVRGPQGAGHELFHGLAARAQGVAPRFRVSRRLFLLVFESDVSELWTIPPAKRYGPYLAGMAFDTVVLAVCLTIRLLAGAGLIHASGLARFAAALALSCVMGLAGQALVFLRTDLYAVLVTALGCFNLYQVTYLTLMRVVPHMRAEASRALAAAHPRDRQVARWFVWLYLMGLGLAGFFFVTVFLPAAAVMITWLYHTLTATPVRSPLYWEALVIGTFFLVQTLAPLWIFVQERRRRRPGLAA